MPLQHQSDYRFQLCVCVSDSASARSSTSYIIQLVAAQRCLQGSIMALVIKETRPPSPPAVQLIPAYLQTTGERGQISIVLPSYRLISLTIHQRVSVGMYVGQDFVF